MEETAEEGCESLQRDAARCSLNWVRRSQSQCHSHSERACLKNLDVRFQPHLEIAVAKKKKLKSVRLRKTINRFLHRHKVTEGATQKYHHPVCTFSPPNLSLMAQKEVQIFKKRSEPAHVAQLARTPASLVCGTSSGCSQCRGPAEHMRVTPCIKYPLHQRRFQLWSGRAAGP